MDLPSYKEALVMGKEKIGKTLAPLKAKRAEKRAEMEMLELEEQIATKEAAVSEECCKEDVSFKKIIELQDEIGLLIRKKSQYQEILDKMFPAD